MNDINVISQKDFINPQQNQEYVQCTQKKLEEILTGELSKLFANNKNKIFCFLPTLINLKIFYMILGGINFILIITALSTLIKKNKYYLFIRAEVISTQADYSSLLGYGYSYLTGSSLDDKNLNLPSFSSFWCNIGKVEDGVLISYLIFLILYLGFEVFTFLIHKNKIKLKIEGILYHIIVGLNILFLIIFYIYIPLVAYLFIYSIIVSASSPLSVNNHGSYKREKSYIEKDWDKHKGIPIFNSIVILILFIFTFLQLMIKKEIMLYLSMRYEEEEISKEKVKSKNIYINNQKLNIEVKANQILYLEEQQTKKISKFKQIKFEDKNNFSYIRLDNIAIRDILSFTDWEYPDLNDIFLKLGKISKYIYGVLFISILLLRMHINKEGEYQLLVTMNNLYSNTYYEKPKFYDLFLMYGTYEKSITQSRFILYIITLFILLLLMLKRIYFGGFSKYIFSLISFISTFVFLLENIIFLILSFILIIASIFSLASYYDISKGSYKDDMIQTKLFIQLFFNIPILILIIFISYENIHLIKSLNQIRIEVQIISKNLIPENQEIRMGYQYNNIDDNNKQYYLSELIIDNHPRYLYYDLYDDINKIHQKPQMLNLNNTNSINNKNPNNKIVIDDNHSERSDNTLLVNSKDNNNVNIIAIKNDTNNKKKKRRNSKKNSHINRNNKELDKEKIKSENINLKKENKMLKEELDMLEKQLNSIIKEANV